jgi:hypothetical protein
VSDQPTFTGSESPADVARAAIEWFAQQPHDADFTIFYDNSIPKMRYKFDADWVEFECVYRLDRMLESFYSDAEQIFDQNAKANFIEAELRPILVPVIAFAGMTAILSRVLILQGQMFLEMFDEIRVTTSGMFLHSLVTQSPHRASLSRGASKVIQDWIDKAVEIAMKKKRDFLVGYMNIHPLINIPTGVGRPKGSRKSEEKKAKEKAEFESTIQQTVKTLFYSLGREPFKYEVAEALGIGGINPKGTDSRINSFNNKLARLGIDYPAIISRLNLHE